MPPWWFWCSKKGPPGDLAPPPPLAEAPSLQHLWSTYNRIGGLLILGTHCIRGIMKINIQSFVGISNIACSIHFLLFLHHFLSTICISVFYNWLLEELIECNEFVDGTKIIFVKTNFSKKQFSLLLICKNIRDE